MRENHLKVLRFEPSGRPKRRETRRKKYFYAGIVLYALLASALWLFSALEVKRLSTEVAALLEDTERMKVELFQSIKTARGRETGRNQFRAVQPASVKASPEHARTSSPGRDPAPKLAGIISGGNEALAIIGSGLYREGDVVDGYRIAHIGADHVLLERDGKAAVVKVTGEAR